jgi:flavodoxin I
MKTAIIYSFNTIKTAKIAQLIKDAFEGDTIEMVNAEDINGKTFMKYKNLILGVPTWFDGELPNYWDEFVPELEELNLKGYKIALFGLGDQKSYPENFVDGIGILGIILEKQGAKLIGFTSTEGYSFENSAALKNDMFMGLAIDYENQGSKNKERVKKWVEQIKKEFS